jgi:hypothetical protein
MAHYYGGNVFQKFKTGVDPFAGEQRLKTIKALPAETAKKLEHAVNTLSAERALKIDKLKTIHGLILSNTFSSLSLRGVLALNGFTAESLPADLTKETAANLVSEMIKQHRAHVAGLEMVSAQMQQDKLKDTAKMEFLVDFWKWINGKGNEADHKGTKWGRIPLRFPDVIAYQDAFIDVKFKFLEKIKILEEFGPSNLNESFLYFKYIVRGSKADKNGLGFLDDWDKIIEESVRIGDEEFGNLSSYEWASEDEKTALMEVGRNERGKHADVENVRNAFGNAPFFPGSSSGSNVRGGYTTYTATATPTRIAAPAATGAPTPTPAAPKAFAPPPPPDATPKEVQQVSQEIIQNHAAAQAAEELEEAEEAEEQERIEEEGEAFRQSVILQRQVEEQNRIREEQDRLRREEEQKQQEQKQQKEQEERLRKEAEEQQRITQQQQQLEEFGKQLEALNKVAEYERARANELQQRAEQKELDMQQLQREMQENQQRHLAEANQAIQNVAAQVSQQHQEQQQQQLQQQQLYATQQIQNLQRQNEQTQRELTELKRAAQEQLNGPKAMDEDKEHELGRHRLAVEALEQERDRTFQIQQAREQEIQRELDSKDDEIQKRDIEIQTKDDELGYLRLAEEAQRAELAQTYQRQTEKDQQTRGTIQSLKTELDRAKADAEKAENVAQRKTMKSRDLKQQLRSSQGSITASPEVVPEITPEVSPSSETTPEEGHSAGVPHTGKQYEVTSGHLFKPPVTMGEDPSIITNPDLRADTIAGVSGATVEREERERAERKEKKRQEREAKNSPEETMKKKAEMKRKHKEETIKRGKEKEISKRREKKDKEGGDKE